MVAQLYGRVEISILIIYNMCSNPDEGAESWPGNKYKNIAKGTTDPGVDCFDQ